MRLSFGEHEDYRNFKKKMNVNDKKDEMSDEELKEWEDWAEKWKDSDELSE
ncbi:TPA: hypothetical protein HA278_07590 [Candidatus Woesearchaeota archaeon]|jgi:hypothetical protein|nr:hypothetical protein [Candidatus Woesearchaeota archaeon]